VATAAHLSASFLLAFITALAATPLAIRLAKRTAFYDHPEGYKAHLAPTPYLGGAAVLIAFAIGGLVIPGGHREVGLILVVAVGLWIVGTVDDRRTLRPAYRLVAAALAGALLWANGVGWHVFPTDGANLAFTILWVVGLVNAFNLMDNMDGAASAVASASGAGAAVLALIEGAPHLAGLGLALSGACLGFLRFNLASPARIFLGDGGSMPIGFLLAAMTMAMWPSATLDLRSLVPVLLIVGLVIFDTVLVVISRHRRRVPIYKGARDHTTHRLRAKLGSARAVSATLAVVQSGLCVFAVTVATGDDAQALFVAVVCVGSGLVSGLLLEIGPLAFQPTASFAAATLRRPAGEPRSTPEGTHALAATGANSGEMRGQVTQFARSAAREREDRDRTQSARRRPATEPGVRTASRQ
jgi:UDP-GlcNAc:undecaprenyl-phosphate GlcNAc-1-phosphate transferase